MRPVRKDPSAAPSPMDVPVRTKGVKSHPTTNALPPKIAADTRAKARRPPRAEALFFAGEEPVVGATEPEVGAVGDEVLETSASSFSISSLIGPSSPVTGGRRQSDLVDGCHPGWALPYAIRDGHCRTPSGIHKKTVACP